MIPVVIADKPWECGEYPWEQGEMFNLLEEYFYNGEHWSRLEAKNGKRFDAPSIFFRNAVTKKMFLNLLLQFIDTDDGDAHDEWFDPYDMVKEVGKFVIENNYD